MTATVAEAHAPAIAPGFADPVHEAQRAFRAVMEALARPGTVHPLAGLAEAPAPLAPTAAAVALTLSDYETPLYLDAPLAARSEVARYLAFHTGARLAAAPSQAAFALIADPAGLPDFGAFALGTDAYPDRSTTLIVQVEGLYEDVSPAAACHSLVLEGPGIKGEARLAVAGLPRDIAARLAANRALFPRGVDLILAGPDAVAALPRTTRVRA